MRGSYDDYARSWINEHPIQEFFLGLGIDYGEHKYGMYSKYKDNPELGGMMSIRPNENGLEVFSIGLYVVVIFFLTHITSIGEIPFIWNLYLFGGVIMCHLTYMYHFMTLPCVKHSDSSGKFILNKILCVVGLIIPLKLFYSDLVIYMDYLKFVEHYNLSETYNEEVTRKVYWRKYFSEEAKTERENKTIDAINTLMGTIKN